MGDHNSNIIKIGPVCVVSYSGTYGNNPWDYKGCNKIFQIFISHGEKGINSLQFQYEQNGALVMSKCHGPIMGDKFDIVTLNHPMEFITSLSGYRNCPSYSTFKIFASLSISTNMRKFGPFGCNLTAGENEFRFHVGQYAKFWGFYGSSNINGLTSIGIYLKTVTILPTPLDQNVVVPKKEAE